MFVKVGDTARFKAASCATSNRSSDSNDLALSVLQDDQLTINFLSSVATHDICRVKRVCLDVSCLPERATKDDVEVALFGEVDSVHRLSLADFDGPGSQAENNTL